MATEPLIITVSETGATTVKRNLEDLGNTGKNAGVSIDGLKTALTALVAGEVTRKLIEMADAFTEVQNRLRLVTTGVENLNAVQEALLSLSQQTHTDFETNTELFTRFAKATEYLGLSQRDALNFTRELQLALKVSGATSQQAEAGLLDLAKAMSTGRLEGRQLIALFRDLPAAADIIAKSLGVSRDELKRLGQEGRLTGDTIIKAFRDAEPELQEKFKHRVETIKEAFIDLKNQVGETFGQFSSASGGPNSLVGILESMVSALHDITPQIVTMGQALAGTLSPTAGLSDQMKGVAVTLVTLIGIIETVAKVVYDVLGGAFRTVGQLIGGVAASIAAAISGNFKEAGRILADTVTGTFSNVKKTFVDTGTDLGETTAKTVKKITDIWDAAGTAVGEKAKKVAGGDGVSDVRGASHQDPLNAQQHKIVDDLTESLKKQAQQLEVMARSGDGAAAALDRLKAEEILNKNNINFVPDSVLKALQQLKDARAEEGVAKISLALKHLNEELRVQIAAGPAAALATARLKAEQELAKAGVIGLTEALKAQFDQLEASQRELAATSIVQQLTDTTGELAIQAQLGYKSADAIAAYRLQVQLAALGNRELSDAIKEALEAQSRQQNDVLLRGLQDELELHSRIGNELRIETEVRKLSASATESQRNEVRRLVEAQIDQENKLKQYQQVATTVAKGAESAFAQFLFDPFKNGLRGMLLSFVDTLRQMAAQLLANAILKKVLGAVAGGGGTTGGFATLALEALGGRAEGGPVNQGQPVWVGEKGEKELFVPHSNGTVLNKQQIAQIGGAAGKQVAPQVTVPVQVVNVRDPNEIPNSINGHPATGQAILNFIGDNRTAISQMLGK